MFVLFSAWTQQDSPYCLQCSEDALVVWAGSNIFRGVYGGPAGVAYVLGIIYFGVVVSDMVRQSSNLAAARVLPMSSVCKEAAKAVAGRYIECMNLCLQLTFYLGVALQKGFFKSLKKSLFRYCALHMHADAAAFPSSDALCCSS